MRRVPRIPYRESRLLNRILGRIGGEESCEHPGNSRSVNSLTRKSSLPAATETPGRVTLVAIKARIQLSYTLRSWKGSITRRRCADPLSLSLLSSVDNYAAMLLLIVVVSTENANN